METEVVCFPGQRICAANDSTIAGLGTYERLGYIFASLAGIVETTTQDKVKISCFSFISLKYHSRSLQNNIISVKALGNKTILPVVGDIVTARVEIVNQRFAKCQIICIGDVLLNRPLRGILRKEDVRATDIDRIEMYKNFRPNDIILAKVIPQIEIHTFSLSTAENELGVVLGKSYKLTADLLEIIIFMKKIYILATPRGLAASCSRSSTTPMIPISWLEMQCPLTGIKEPRKVAKIMSENSLVKIE